MQKELYDRFYETEQRHWWFVGRRALVRRFISKVAPPGRMLDVGCGTGGTLAELPADRLQIGLDASPLAAQYCRKRGVAVALGSGTDLPFATDTFAVVLALDVIEHLDDDVGMLREVRRVLRPDGVAIITVPALPWLWSGHDVANQHRRRYVGATLARALAEAGLQPRQLSYYNSVFLPAMAARKLILRGAGGSDGLGDLPAPLNGLMRRIFEWEGRVVGRCGLPIGGSLICVASAADVAESAACEPFAAREDALTPV